MTAVLLLFCVCIIVYAVVIFLVATRTKNNNKNLILITSPTAEEIAKEKVSLRSSEALNYPDKEFEKICQYILCEDCTARQVVKFIHNYFPEPDNSDKKLLLSCLRLNKPQLYNEVSGLIYCDSTSFEEFQPQTIPIETPEPSFKTNKTFNTGIPADFFFTSLEIVYSSPEAKNIHAILENIHDIYESLSPESQASIEKQSKIIRKKQKNKKILPEQKNVIEKAIQEGNLVGEKFMEQYRELAN